MSGQMKVKSLSLSRRTQTPPRKEESVKAGNSNEDDAQISNLEAVLNSPIARPSRLCSTPIQKHVDLMEDSPDQDYRESPTSLYPCTQDSNEIAWDWQSGVKKDSGSPSGVDKRNRNNAGALSNTPKRPQQLFPKKRSAKSYSPLLNVPNKRKLAKKNLDVAESIGKFAAELSALAEKIKTEQEDEGTRSNECRKNNEDHGVGDILAGTSKGLNDLGIFDLKTQAPFDIHEVTTLEVSYIADEKTDPEKPDSSLDDLFDDSVDACMVQCSQDIEDKLKLSSGGSKALGLSSETKSIAAGTSASFANPNIVPKSCGVNVQTNHNGKSDEKLASKSSGSCTKVLLANDIPASQIPDDSFDDCLALCLDEDDELMSKFMENTKTETDTKLNSVKISNPVETSSNFKRKQQCMGSDAALATSQSRKYFKSKSLSDSYCGNSVPGGKTGINNNNFNSNSNLGRSYPPPTTKSNSTHNLSSKIGAQGNPDRVFSAPNLNSCISAAGGRSNSTSNLSKPGVSGNTVSYSYIKNLSTNPEEIKPVGGNFDPYSRSEKWAENPLTKLRTTVPSSQYNAEEIEKKRLEAKMRLEANRLKKQMNINKSNGGISLQNKRPFVKR